MRAQTFGTRLHFMTFVAQFGWCSCQNETVCASTFCMQLHYFDMLSHSLSVSLCPYLSGTVCAHMIALF